jgi:hypothetical protein
LEVASVEDVVTAGDEYRAHKRKVMSYLLFVIGEEGGSRNEEKEFTAKPQRSQRGAEVKH